MIGGQWGGSGQGPGGQWSGFDQEPDRPPWDERRWDERRWDEPGRDFYARPPQARRQQPARRHSHRRSSRLRGLFRGRRAILGLGVTGAGIAAVALAIAVTVGQVTGSGTACAAVLSDASSQIATHYVLEGLPNCSYPNPPANQLFVALSPSEYNSAAACGGYLQVTGPDGSVIVQVIDQCPECATGHIDLSEPAFAKLAPLVTGLINVSYSYLVNPALPGPITAEVKTGSSQYWLALLFDNTGNPLSSVQVEGASGSWISLSRANYNYWIAQSGAGNGPFTVRLTDNQGHQVTVGGITLSPGSVQTTSTYMYGAGSTPTVAPTTPAATQPSTTPATSASGSPKHSATPTPSAPSTSAKASGTPAARRSATASASAVAKRAKPAAAAPPVPPSSAQPSPHPSVSASC